MAQPSYAGVGGLGQISTTPFNNFLDVMKSFHFRHSWASYETANGVYNHSYLTNQWQIAVDNGLYVGAMDIVSPQSSGNTPSFLFNVPLSVPLVTTDRGAYPYYYSTAYKTKYFAMLDAFRADIAAFSFGGLFIFLQSAEGSTGDESPYKGTIRTVSINGVNQSNPSFYDITDDSWNTFKQSTVWIPLYDDINTDIPFAHLMINQGNDNSNLAWALANIPTSWVKAGQFTHYYNFPNEGNYAANLAILKSSSTNDNRIRGELEGTIDAQWWIDSPTQNTTAILFSALHGGVDIFNIAPVNAISNHTAYLLFNKYAGLRNASDGSVGFCYLRDMLDFTDMNRFPPTTYQPLVSSADQANYNKAYTNIVNSGHPQDQIESQLTNLLIKGNSSNNNKPYLNAARITAVLAANSTAGYQPIDQDTVSYYMDCGAYMIPDNYFNFVRQWNPNGTSVGVFRVSSANDIFGRNGRRTDYLNSKRELYFSIDSGLIGSHNYQVKIKVWYLNSGTNHWSLYYFNGTEKVVSETIVNTNTGASTSYEFTIDDFQGGGNLDNLTDFTLKYESGNDQTFFLVEVEKAALNTEGTPVSAILGNSLTSICSGSSVTLYTDGAFAVSKVLYSDHLLQTIQTGYAYLITNSDNHIYSLNTSTGVIGSDTGGICGGGTAGTYILGTNSVTVCGNTPVALYTSGSFSVGKVLYSDINLTQIVTGSTFVVTSSDSKIYALNTSTGVVGAYSGLTCNSGTAGTYKTGNSSSTVCAQSNTTLYTSGAFAAGKVLYTAIGLITPATGFSFVVDTATSFIYSVNSGTGAVIAQVGICSGGTSETARLGNSITTVCNQSTTTVYSNGAFGVDKILYSDINLINILTGYTFAVRTSTNHVYNINTSTGLVVGDSGTICGNGTKVHGKKK